MFSSNAINKYLSIACQVLQLKKISEQHLALFKKNSSAQKIRVQFDNLYKQETDFSYRKSYMTEIANEINQLQNRMDGECKKYGVTSLNAISDSTQMIAQEKIYNEYLKIKKKIESHRMPELPFDLNDPDYLEYKKSINQVKILRAEILREEPALEKLPLDSENRPIDEEKLSEIGQKYFNLLKILKSLEDEFRCVITNIERLPPMVIKLNRHLSDFLAKSMQQKYLNDIEKIAKKISPANTDDPPPAINPLFYGNINQSSENKSGDERFPGFHEAIINTIHNNERQMLYDSARNDIINSHSYKDFLRLTADELRARLQPLDEEYTKLYHFLDNNADSSGVKPEKAHEINNAKERKKYLELDRNVLLVEYNKCKNLLWEYYNVFIVSLPEFSVYQRASERQDEKIIPNPTHPLLKPTVLAIDKTGDPNNRNIAIKSLDKRTDIQDKRMIAIKTVESYINENHKQRLYISGNDEELINIMKSYCDAMRDLLKDPVEKKKYERYPDKDLTFFQRQKIASSAKQMKAFIKEKGIDTLRGLKSAPPGFFNNPNNSVADTKQEENADDIILESPNPHNNTTTQRPSKHRCVIQ